MITLASTAIPMVSTSPAIPGRVSVASKPDRIASDEEEVEQQAQVADDPRAAVVVEHEQDHQRRRRS